MGRAFAGPPLFSGDRMGTIRVMYVGSKPREIDNKKAKTGIVWTGHGDIQDVPDWAWPILAKHPDVWVDVPPEPGKAPTDRPGLSDIAPPAKVPQEVDDADLKAMTQSVVPPESSAPDLYTMNTAALREYAASKGYGVDLTLKGQALRAAVQAAGG